MLAYVTLGTNDLERATAFYDSLLGALNVSRMAPNDRIRLWRAPGEGPMLGIAKPYDGEPATAGNGTMAAISVSSNALVDALHSKALELGGTDEGAPGPRGPKFYCGYFRDLDGNKLVAIRIND
jgi:predicted lactoylglutathione lyase